MVFFDMEKAYDMLWKDGLLIKLESIGHWKKNVELHHGALCSEKLFIPFLFKNVHYFHLTVNPWV